MSTAGFEVYCLERPEDRCGTANEYVQFTSRAESMPVNPMGSLPVERQARSDIT